MTVLEPGSIAYERRHEDEWWITDRTGDMIAIVFQEDEGEATARLFVAAPDLLAACEELLRTFGEPHYDDQVAAVRMARAAIAKARGGGEG